MHIHTLLPAFLLLLATADASAVFPRKDGGKDQGSDDKKDRGSGSPSEYCPSVSSDCYRTVSTHRRKNSGFCGDFKSKKDHEKPDDMKDYSREDVNNACDCGQGPAPQCKSVSVSCYDDVKTHGQGDAGFCRRFNSPQSCDLPDDLRRYSRPDVSSACYCLEPAPSQSPSPSGPTQHPSPQCPSSSNDCYNDVKSHREKDDSFCGKCKHKESCEQPSDMSKYSREDMSNACDCLEPGRNNPSPQCPASSNECYNEVKSRRDKDDGFCGKCKDKDSCEKPSDMSKYSREDMSNACDCLEPGRNVRSPMCPASSNDCYNEVKSRREKDDGFCGRCKNKDSCEKPSDMFKYSHEDMSNACDCLEPGRNYPSPQCPAASDNCYRDIKSRREKDSEFCSKCKDKDNCQRPDELSMYSRGDMSKACDCLEPGRNNPSPQCPATYDNCYRDVKSQREKDNEFCSKCKDKDNCERPTELSMYSRSDMTKACDCLEPGRQTPSPQCPATYDNCFRDVKQRRDEDSELCNKCKDKDNCDRPDELSAYSRSDMSKACDCLEPGRHNPSPQCPAVSDNCYRAVEPRREQTCRKCTDKDNCEKPVELAGYSRDEVSKACKCMPAPANTSKAQSSQQSTSRANMSSTRATQSSARTTQAQTQTQTSAARTSTTSRAASSLPAQSQSQSRSSTLRTTTRPCPTSSSQSKSQSQSHSTTTRAPSPTRSSSSSSSSRTATVTMTFR